MISLKSSVTQKLLNYFFINPDASAYVNELARKFALDKRNLIKKIKELESEGILRYQTRGNLKLYSINKQYPFYNEYKKIIMATIGLDERLLRILKNIKGVKEAYIYGSYANNKMQSGSDIDLLVVGSHSALFLQRHLSKLQREIDREINVTNMDETDFKKRVRNKDPFITGLMAGKFIRLL